MNQYKNYLKPIFVIIIIALIGTGCKKDFLDVNDNPNSPEKVDIIYVLPSAQQAVAYTLGNQFNIVGGIWSQYWTQGPNANQYNDIDRNSYTASDADRPWRQLYADALIDFDFVANKGIEQGKPNHAAIAKIMEAYTYQLATDAFGDIPFSEALKGADNTSPKFDSQKDVYAGIIKLIDDGIAIMDPLKPIPGNEDLIYAGDMDLWLKFANTLKLKVYLRERKVNPSVDAKISALLTDNTFIDFQEDAVVKYADATSNQHPLFASFSTLTDYNLLASNTAINYLTTTNDPRIADFYNPNDNGGVFAGIDQGDGKQLAPPQDNADYSFPGPQVLGPAASVIFISGAESYFLQAEANALGLGSGDGQVEYETAIEISWSMWENSAAAISSDLPTFLTSPDVDYTLAASTNDKVKLIITQKWVAMTGNQTFEAWTERRRTGFPDFLVESATTIIPGKFPKRLLYSGDEASSNINFPGQKLITDKVWWGI